MWYDIMMNTQINGFLHPHHKLGNSPPNKQTKDSSPCHTDVPVCALQLCGFHHCAITCECFSRHLYFQLSLLHTTREGRRICSYDLHQNVTSSGLWIILFPYFITSLITLPIFSPLIPPFFLFSSYKHILLPSPCLFFSLLPLIMSHG